MAEENNYDNPDISAVQPLPLTTSCNEVRKSDLPVNSNFNVGRFSALQYLSWLQSSISMCCPRVAPNSCSYREQSASPLVGFDYSHDFSTPKTPTFYRQDISSSNLISTFSALMSAFSAPQLTAIPYGSLPYNTQAPIPSEKPMPSTSAFQSAFAEYSSLLYQKQIWQQAIPGTQSVMEIERFMTSNSIYSLHNTKKALLDQSADATVVSQSMGSTVYTPPPSPRNVSEEPACRDTESKDTDFLGPDEDVNLMETTYNRGRGRKLKNRVLNMNHNSDCERTFYTCKRESCGKKFNRSVNLLSHQRTHHEEQPSVSKMESCGESYEQRQYSEKKECSREHSFMCRWKFCKKRFKTLGFCLRHEQTHETVRSSTALQSSRYKHKSFENSQDQPYHPRESERIFVCKEKLCGKSFKRLHHLQRHRLVHTGERNFICKTKFCGKSYMRLDNLQGHEVSHTGERPYACSWSSCGKNYTRRDHLRRHELIHTGESFTCESPLCGRSFFRSDHFRKHQYTHLKQKRFKCECCKRQFKQLNHLRLHEKVHRSYVDGGDSRGRTTRSSSFRTDGDNSYLVRSRSLRRSIRRSCN